MKKLFLLVLLCATYSGLFSQDLGGLGFSLVLWRDSSGVLVPVPAGKAMLFTSPLSGTSGFLKRNATAPASGTLTPATATDTIQAPYFNVTTKLIPPTSGQVGLVTRNATAPQSGYLTPATATDTLDVPYLYINGVGQYRELVKSADTTKATAPFADIGELEFNMVASGVYEIEGTLYLVRATAANGYTIAFNFTAAPTATAFIGAGLAAVAVGTDMVTENFMDTNLDSLQLTATTVTTGEYVTLKGRIDNAASVNAFKLRWSCELGTNVTLKRRSYIRYRRLY